MKFKLKLPKNQLKKDFIREVEENLNQVKQMLNEVDGIKEVLEKYKEKPLEIEIQEKYSSNYMLRIEMNDQMIEYLKDRLAKLEEKIKERVV